MIARTARVATLADLTQKGRLSVSVDERAVLLVHIAGEVFAFEDVCTHDGQPLTDGELEGHQIECPRHGARFDVRTGRALCMPAVEPVRVYPVRIIDGAIEIELPD